MKENNKFKLKQRLKDIPYSLGAASLAIIFGLGQGIITMAGVAPVSKKTGKKMGIAGSVNWAIENSRDFVSDYIEIKKTLKDLTENNSRVILHRLQKKGLVEKKNNEFKLTFLGKRYFKKINEEISSRKKWDNKWRIVFFDIPEKLRKERAWLRFQLYGLGYQPLQKSVFLGKFSLTEDIFREIIIRKLNNFIRIITVGEIDDEKILETFNKN